MKNNYRFKKFKSFLEKLRIVFSLPNTWISLIILTFAIISMFMSIILNNNGNTFGSSIFSNIFAGLITGFAITVMSNVKSTYLALLEAKRIWLEETHKMIMDFIDTHHQLYSSQKLSNDERYNLAYDVICRANWVNDRIIQGTFNKVKWFDTSNYFLHKYKYDSLAVSNIMYKCRENVMNIGFLEKKKTITIFEDIYKLMLRLNHMILDDINTINIKIVSSRKSIL
jgi:hypothetical protein